MKIINTKIAGVFQYPEGKEGMKKMISGESYSWEAEPENPYDKNAIAIFLTGHHPSKCGYVPRVIAAEIGADQIVSITKGSAFDHITITTSIEE